MDGVQKSDDSNPSGMLFSQSDLSYGAHTLVLQVANGEVSISNATITVGMGDIGCVVTPTSRSKYSYVPLLINPTERQCKPAPYQRPMFLSQQMASSYRVLGLKHVIHTERRTYHILLSEQEIEEIVFHFLWHTLAHSISPAVSIGITETS